MKEFIIHWYSRSILNFQPSEIKKLFTNIETKSKQLITNNLHQEFNNMFKRKLAVNLYIQNICIFV